ncbi:hypothetical protein JCM10003_3204 [Bacteroides pyogenes JCM 10003]|nr:hypothetical protein JCM10003_3204 [Bacteroides pyogenes JCM 10003]
MFSSTRSSVFKHQRLCFQASEALFSNIRSSVFKHQKLCFQASEALFSSTKTQFSSTAGFKELRPIAFS